MERAPRSPVTDRIIFGVPRLDNSRSCSRAIEFARGMTALGFDATVLATEPELGDPAPDIEGVKADQVPRAPHDRASDIWLSLIQYLEENAPCAYVTSDDRIASLVCCRLSNRVRVIGLLYENTAQDLGHCARLGQYWNAVVVRDATLRQRIIGEHPKYAERLAITGDDAEDLAELIAEIDRAVESGKFRRPRRKLRRPPPHLIDGMWRRDIDAEVKRVNAVPMWPDWYEVQKSPVRGTSSGPSLTEHRVIFALPTGRVSGVDVFSIILARELIKRGYNAELVQTLPDDPVADRMAFPTDVPVGQLTLQSEPTWAQRWDAMRRYLEERAPCIYLPNYDRRHSGIIPTLSPSVKVVGHGHSDDSRDYAHVQRLAAYWDAVVGVSSQVSATIASLAPGIEQRQWTIPYGVPGPDSVPERSAAPVLRVVYAGRIVRFQKRALDLLSIARHLRDRGARVEITVAGTGSDLNDFMTADSDLMLSRYVRYVGGLTNEQVRQLIAESDVFILPSSFEGLPVSLLEAMANGCVPVVSAIRSGVPEVIQQGENGFTVPIGDTGAFADRIMQLEGDRELLSRMRARAHRTVRDRYSVEAMASSYIEVFDSIISKPFARPTGPMKWPAGLSRLEAVMPRLPLRLRRIVGELRGNT